MRSLLLSLVSNALVAAAVSTTPSVTIDAGTLEGGQCNGSSDAVYFKSIPFALPPTGGLRFAPPQPYTKKYPGGSLVATSPAASCIQFGAEFAETDDLSEDCLYLDIWAPARATKDSALPVKVWIYGGGEAAGGISDTLYDGCNVAKDDALIVSINYRLGPLGFLALESAGIQGNQGIQDLLLGLDWVQSNIATFGGDPKKVLLFGQSAGATNAFVIATLPQAPRLIRAVISESGGGRDVPLKATAQNLGTSYAKSLDCGLGDVACLQSKSVSDLISSFTNLPLLNSGIGIDGALSIASIQTSQFAPYLDGKIIPAQPSAEGVRVPTVFGSNGEEGTLFALGQYAANPLNAAAATAQDYNTFLLDNFGAAAASLIKQNYPLSKFAAYPYPAFFAMAAVLTASSYTCPAYRGLNRAVEKGIPVWTYLFSHNPSCTWLSSLPQEAVPLVGATHTAEIPFAFGNLVNLPVQISNGTCNATQQERDISAWMIKSWTAMASTGDPSIEDLQWPAYGGASNTTGVNIVNSTTAGVVDYSVCKLWDQIEKMQLSASSGGSNSTGALNSTASPTRKPTAPASSSAGSTATGTPSTTAPPFKGASSKVVSHAVSIVLSIAFGAAFLL